MGGNNMAKKWMIKIADKVEDLDETCNVTLNVTDEEKELLLRLLTPRFKERTFCNENTNYKAYTDYTFSGAFRIEEG